MSRDRRQIPRTEIALKIEPLDGAGVMYAHDLSLGGMLVTTRDPRWPGQLVPIRFRLPGETRSIRATCQVMNLVDVPVGVGLALRFVKLHPEAAAAIHQFVDKRPIDEPADLTVASRATAWVQRMIEDCAELKALARP